MLETEAMALLVSAGVSYGRREAALMAAGSARALADNPEAFAAHLGEKGFPAYRRALREADKRLEDIERQGMKLVVRGGENYPRRLEQIVHPPHLLYVWGDMQIDEPFPVAVIGTRQASAYGLRHARRIACDLAKAGVCVVSGIALGIDACAHEGALDAQGRTIAVLGGALDRFYPEENRTLMERILDAGGSVISEYPPGKKPERFSFLQRNRIIAGMSLGVLVVEGPKRSGAASTAQYALEEGREVFALPGSIDNPASELPNRLLAEGAQLIVSARDILDTLVIEPIGTPKRENVQHEPALFVPEGLSGTPLLVCRALLSGEKDFDDLCMAAGEDSSEMGALLIEMEMDELVVSHAGCMYAPGPAMERKNGVS